MKRLLLIAAGGGLGAVLRYQVQIWMRNRLGASFPYGTLVVNISGAFLIGALMTIFLDHMDISSEWRVFLIIGILGGYTTFSSLTWETYQLFAAGSAFQGCLYVSGSFFGGMLGLVLGIFLGRQI